jgi:hypothetical protein
MMAGIRKAVAFRMKGESPGAAIFEETASGGRLDRPELRRMLEQLRTPALPIPLTGRIACAQRFVATFWRWQDGMR